MNDDLDLDFDTLVSDPRPYQPPTPSPQPLMTNPQPPTPNPRHSLGEVVAASYSRFTAESYRLHELPPLGGLVVVEQVLGVVCEAGTEGLGPINARGGPDDADGAVYHHHPDLERTLKSQFSALVVGHYAGADAALPPDTRRIIYTYPDCPPRVHYKAYAASDAELTALTERPHYLRLLLQAPDAAVDEVIIHLLARAYRVRGGDRAHLLRTTEFLGRLLKGQYDRLVAILETVEALTADVVPTPGPARSNGTLPPGVGQVRI
jgi:hypothetical protein